MDGGVTVPRLKNSFARTALVLVIGLLLTAPWGLWWLHLDNSIEQWVAEDPAASGFQADFGAEDFLLLAYGGGELFDIDALDRQLAVLDAVEAVPEVSSVQSIPSLFRDQFGAESGEELEEEITTTPFYEKAIISSDHQMGGMIIGSNVHFTAQTRRAYVESIRTAAEPFRSAGWQVHLVGPGALNAALDQASEAESRRLLPLAVLISTILLWLSLRSLKKVLIVNGVSALTLGITLGLMGWLDLTINMVTVALPPVLWVLSTAYTVHLIRYYDAAIASGTSIDGATEEALAMGLRPCLLAATTTCLGFLALLTADMVPVRELGIAAALGIPVAFVVTMGVAPLLLHYLRPTSPDTELPRDGVGNLRAGHYAKPILLAAVVLAVVSAFFTTRVDIQSNPLNFLPSDAPIVRDSEVVAQQFTGLYTLETVLALESSWLHPESWPLIEFQTAALQQAAGVARVLSPLDYLKKLNQWAEGGDAADYRLPVDQATAEALIDDVPEGDLGPLASLISPDGARVRLSALVNVMDGKELLAIVDASRAALTQSGSDVRGDHTGVVLRLVEAQFALIRTQLKSLGFAMLIIFGCIALGIRSARLLALAIAPNLAPVLALFGLMGLAGIPLDPATVMVAAMVLGIAVDDTMHLLLTWRDFARESANPALALEQAVRVNGPAMTTTTVMACAGFLVLALSDFGPIRYFGQLSAAAMAVALCADLWLLPALIHLSRARKGTPA